MNSQDKETITSQETGITEDDKAYWEGYYSSKARETVDRTDTWYQRD